jgi:hypothetical protein
MSRKRSLEYIRDLLMPGNAGFNDKYGTNHDIHIDKQNKRIVLSDGRVYLNNKQCKTWEDQRDQLNNFHSKRCRGEK